MSSRDNHVKLTKMFHKYRTFLNVLLSLHYHLIFRRTETKRDVFIGKLASSSCTAKLDYAEKSNNATAINDQICPSINVPLRLTASFGKLFKILSCEILEAKFRFSTQTLI